MRILIVEDNPAIAACEADILAEAGHEIVGVAASFQEAFVIACDVQPALALLDFRLASAIDGTVAARELGKRFGTRCVLITAFPQDVTRLAPEFDGRIVPKPFTRDQLLAAVEDAGAALGGPHRQAGAGSDGIAAGQMMRR